MNFYSELLFSDFSLLLFSMFNGILQTIFFMKGDIILWRKKETHSQVNLVSFLLLQGLLWASVIFGDFHTWLQNTAEVFLS